MSLSIDQLAEEALLLPIEDRARLADRLVESLSLTEPDAIQKIWINEALRRRDEIRNGTATAVPGDHGLEHVRRKVGR